MPSSLLCSPGAGGDGAPAGAGRRGPRGGCRRWASDGGPTAGQAPPLQIGNASLSSQTLFQGSTANLDAMLAFADPPVSVPDDMEQLAAAAAALQGTVEASEAADRFPQLGRLEGTARTSRYTYGVVLAGSAVHKQLGELASLSMPADAKGSHPAAVSQQEQHVLVLAGAAGGVPQRPDTSPPASLLEEQQQPSQRGIGDPPQQLLPGVYDPEVVQQQAFDALVMGPLRTALMVGGGGGVAAQGMAGAGIVDDGVPAASLPEESGRQEEEVGATHGGSGQEAPGEQHGQAEHAAFVSAACTCPSKPLIPG